MPSFPTYWGKDAAAVDESLARILLLTQPTLDKLDQVEAVFGNDRLIDWVAQTIAAGSIPPGGRGASKPRLRWVARSPTRCGWSAPGSAWSAGSRGLRAVLPVA